MPKKGRSDFAQASDRVPHAGLGQAAHAIAESADAGQHQRVDRAISSGVRTKTRLAADVLKRLLHAAQIPDVVINDADHGSKYSRMPIVE